MADQTIRRLNISGPETSEIFELPIGKITIGRQAGVEVRLNNPMISRKHAEVECTDAGCTLTDLGSANGTAVSGAKLAANSPHALSPGEVIEMGPFKAVFEQVVLAVPKSKEAVPPKKETAPKKKATPKEQPPKPDAPPPPPPPSKPTREEPKKPEPDYSRPLPGLDYHSRLFLEYLPGIYHTDFMSRLLAIFESVYGPIEWNIDNFDLYLFETRLYPTRGS